MTTEAITASLQQATGRCSASRERRRGWYVVALIASVVVFAVAGGAARAALANRSVTRYLTPEQAIRVLKTAYGALTGRPLQEGRILVVSNSVTIATLSDSVNIRNQAYNPRTGRAWAPSDTSAAWPRGIRGFTDVATGDVYINRQAAIETTTPHEVLHSLAAPAFERAVGLAIYEGATEQLALDALAASRLHLPKAPEYPRERELVGAIAKLAGKDLLVRAYLNGGDDVAALVQAVGADRLSSAKGAAAGGNLAKALNILTRAAPTPVPAASTMASGGFVGDELLEAR